MQFVRDVAGLAPEDLVGFFEGWPVPPSPERHLDLLRGSSNVVMAVDDDGGIVGFVTAISDGVLSAYVPLLEVRPSFRGRGIASALVRELLDDLADMYMVDVVCDEELLPFYERLGLTRWTAAIRRERRVLVGLT
jgi:ribosomal protein S18 acetylase RimI-like enzyme